MDALNRTAWRRAAARMGLALGADARNARMLADPWSRAAHCMVQGWRIRLSQPPTKERVRTRPRPTWEVWVGMEAQLIATKVGRVRHDAWRRWASARVISPRRYIPKSRRPWRGSRCP